MEGTEKMMCGILSRAESSHHARWKNHIRTHIAAHSALLESCCASPMINLHCELWFNSLISTLVFTWAFV